MIPVTPARLPVEDDLAILVEAIRTRMDPRAIWLFGSRARGDHRPDSDWDLVFALADDASDDELDPIVGWGIRIETVFRQRSSRPARLNSARAGVARTR